MQNTFIARLLAKSAPTPDAAVLDAPTAEPPAVEGVAIPAPDAEAVAVERETERPRLGSFARPMPVRGTRMPMNCLWATCDGLLSAQGHNLHICSNCATWFELLPPPDLGVYVGDLAEEDAGDVAGWVM
jgi:hypothetical protein